MHEGNEGKHLQSFFWQPLTLLVYHLKETDITLVSLLSLNVFVLILLFKQCMKSKIISICRFSMYEESGLNLNQC